MALPLAYSTPVREDLQFRILVHEVVSDVMGPTQTGEHVYLTSFCC